ncbi:group III truncated hemoglobin [Balneola vulgaris]|uniref:group III truncated hemoglobin n=1 Tax=Balneola vulgaris TaxID=287535 RepID=UPI00037D412E|nr:group III truncated hemoglobin [Balneola vulgaris]
MDTKLDLQTEEDVRVLVHSFYFKVQQDERLNYIFSSFADVDWDEHLGTMVNFWSNILFQTGKYKGSPYRQHVPLPIIKSDFQRWLNLFFETVDEHFQGSNADLVKEIAERVAVSFTSRMEYEGKFN